MSPVPEYLKFITSDMKTKTSKVFFLFSCIAVSLAAFGFVAPAAGQELEPRTYAAAPVGTNIVLIGAGRSSGDITFDPSLPVTDGKAGINSSFIGYIRTIDFFGRSASVGLVVPYVWGTVSGVVAGEPQQIRRSGLRDPAVRFAVNLKGAPSMDLKEFSKYEERSNIGVSVVVSAPLGQYDPAKIINTGSNRWAVKPEIGFTHKFKRTYLDAYAGVWLYTANNNFQGRVRKQDPIVIGQFHWTYIINKKMWAAFDANFYTGGRSNINGVLNNDLQRNSRIGGTYAYKFDRHHSLKFSYSKGAYTTIGGDFDSIGIAYQYLWGRGM